MPIESADAIGLNSMTEVSKWELEESPILRRRIGKTNEEICELGKVLNRMALQGVDATDPSTGELLIDQLHEEVADVLAQIEVNEKFFKLDMCRINVRKKQKIKQMYEWEGLYL